MTRQLLTEGVYSSRSDEWGTPLDFYAMLDREFRFTLDACATAIHAKCERFYSASDNGLVQDWRGERVFVNPPYSKAEFWMEKCYREAEKGTLVVVLIPARTDTGWWHRWAMKASEVRFVRGRLRFDAGVRVGRINAPFPSAVIVFHPLHLGSYPRLRAMERP